jgi:hypothetical protein
MKKIIFVLFLAEGLSAVSATGSKENNPAQARIKTAKAAA